MLYPIAQNGEEDFILTSYGFHGTSPTLAAGHNNINFSVNAFAKHKGFMCLKSALIPILTWPNLVVKAYVLFSWFKGIGYALYVVNWSCAYKKVLCI